MHIINVNKQKSLLMNSQAKITAELTRLYANEEKRHRRKRQQLDNQTPPNRWLAFVGIIAALLVALVWLAS